MADIKRDWYYITLTKTKYYETGVVHVSVPQILIIIIINQLC